MTDLMNEVEQLLFELLGYETISRYSYHEVFLEKLDIDPHTITVEDLEVVTRERIDINGGDLGKTDYLQLNRCWRKTFLFMIFRLDRKHWPNSNWMRRK